ncbi:MAG: recombinase family protein [Bacilli bacterium]
MYTKNYKEEKKYVIGYIRVSTDKQVQKGYSLDEQKDTIEKHHSIYYSDYELIILSDSGKSATSLEKRFELQKALKLIETGLVESIIIIRQDRIARNVFDDQYILKKSRKYNTKIDIVLENFETKSAMGEFFYNINSAKNQYDSAVTSERTKFCYDGMAKKKSLSIRKASFRY